MRRALRRPERAAHRQTYAGNETAEAEAEGRGDGEQADLVLGHENAVRPTTWHADPASMVSQAADPIGIAAPH